MPALHSSVSAAAPIPPPPVEGVPDSDAPDDAAGSDESEGSEGSDDSGETGVEEESSEVSPSEVSSGASCFHCAVKTMSPLTVPPASGDQPVKV